MGYYAPPPGPYSDDPVLDAILTAWAPVFERYTERCFGILDSYPSYVNIDFQEFDVTELAKIAAEVIRPTNLEEEKA